MFTLTKLEGANKQAGWYSLLQTKSISIGLVDTGFWGVEGRDGIIVLDRGDLYRYTISLLEIPYNEVSEKLRGAEYDLNSEAETRFLESFPFVEIVLAGLQQQSDYWADLAFKWYDELSSVNDASLREVLTGIVDAKWACQKVRQKAKVESK